MTDPPLTVRKTPGIAAWGAWGWQCSNPYCTHRRSSGYSSQAAALRIACHHLVTAFDHHHGMVEASPRWSETRQRATATCRCGYQAEEKTKRDAEDSLHSHIDRLRQQLPRQKAAA